MNSILCLSTAFLMLSLTIKGQQVNPVNITFQREDITLHGKLFPADEESHSPTLLLLPGFPGNNQDILDLGMKIANLGVNMMMFNYSGTHKSEGLHGFERVQEDISAAINFLHRTENVKRFQIDTTNIVLGGYSYGGGMALTYAIKHSDVKKLVSIAGNDWGEHFEDYVTIPWMKTAIDGIIENSESKGLVRFDIGEKPAEFLVDGTKNLDTALYLKRNADDLVGKNILLIAGWDDEGVLIERYTLPLYRALKKAGADNVTIMAFQDNHSFQNSRDEIAEAIVAWIK